MLQHKVLLQEIREFIIDDFNKLRREEFIRIYGLEDVKDFKPVQLLEVAVARESERAFI